MQIIKSRSPDSWILGLTLEVGSFYYVGNYCDAPIMADTENDELIIHDSYYYRKHMSAFVKKGAVRIASSKFTAKLDTVSFENPDKNIVTIILNSSDENLDIFFRINGEVVKAIAEAHSIATYIFSDIQY